MSTIHLGAGLKPGQIGRVMAGRHLAYNLGRNYDVDQWQPANGNEWQRILEVDCLLDHTLE